MPLRLDAVAEALSGQRWRRRSPRGSCNAALAEVEPMADLHASADYRRRVAVTLGVRAIADAYDEAARRA